MPNFDEYFSKTSEKSIIYNGKTIFRVDYFPISNGDRLLITFEKTNSEWKQGILIQLEGIIELVDVQKKIKKGTVFWEDTAPKQIEVVVHPEKSSQSLIVRNTWNYGDSGIESWTNGAAMRIEEIPNGRRYHCNDGHPDENFDDIVFTIQKVDKLAPKKSNKTS